VAERRVGYEFQNCLAQRSHGPWFHNQSVNTVGYYLPRAVDVSDNRWAAHRSGFKHGVGEALAVAWENEDVGGTHPGEYVGCPSVGKVDVAHVGGQKQRVEIARIYLKNPPIIIFDEATSALDSETEKGIFDAWSQVLEGRTTIMIAHRQSTVMLCERAAIIENGKIVECGKPSELAEGSRAFQSLFAIDRESADV